MDILGKIFTTVCIVMVLVIGTLSLFYDWARYALAGMGVGAIIVGVCVALWAIWSD